MILIKISSSSAPGQSLELATQYTYRSFLVIHSCTLFDNVVVVLVVVSVTILNILHFNEI